MSDFIQQRNQSIDINCDLGEGFGIYRIGNDEQLIPWITSANIACGYHAGDAHTMHQTVKQCAQLQVAIGAHPGLPDLYGFGRRTMQITPTDIYDLVVAQLGSLDAFARIYGTRLHHVKPHGALYNQSAFDLATAKAIAHAVSDVDSELILVGLAGSLSIQAARERGLPVAQEAFVDRTYQADGYLTPRTSPQAVIHDIDHAMQQAIQLVTQQSVTTVNGNILPIEADTICIHGDHPQAVSFARTLREHLQKHHIPIQSVRGNGK